MNLFITVCLLFSEPTGSLQFSEADISFISAPLQSQSQEILPMTVPGKQQGMANKINLKMHDGGNRSFYQLKTIVTKSLQLDPVTKSLQK